MKNATLIIGILLIGLSLFGCVSKEEYNSLESNYSKLQTDNNNLRSNYTDLLTEYIDSVNNYTNLVTDYTNLTTTYSELKTTTEAVTKERDQWKTSSQQWQSNYSTLLSSYSNLQSSYSSYAANVTKTYEGALIPPYLSTYNRTVTISFKKLDGTIKYWNIPFDSLESSVGKGYSTRTWSFFTIPTITLKNCSSKGTCTVQDFRVFVEPIIWKTVMASLYAESGSDEQFVKEVWHIATQLTTYSSDIGETPRYSLETFLAGGGDCEDMSILIASMLKAAPVNYNVSLIYMDGYHWTAPQTVNHVITYVSTPSGYSTKIEGTESTIMDPYGTSGVYGWRFEVT